MHKTIRKTYLLIYIASSPEMEALKRTVNDFEFGEVLGEGSYSTVILATEKSTGQQFAAKILDKAHIIKENKVKYVNIQKNALLKLSHSFIVKLYYTFQDNASLYFILELAQKGNLLSLIKAKKKLSIELARFYAAEILLALEYMHSQGIYHRDLKPENILLDNNGHIKITDFGTAKIMSNELSPNSFVGTAEYVPPELLANGHDTSPAKADIWAFGCILYQMLVGQPPFKGINDYQTFQKILRLEYSIPEGMSDSAQYILEKIFVIHPEERTNAVDIKSSAFFKPIDWNHITEQFPVLNQFEENSHLRRWLSESDEIDRIFKAKKKCLFSIFCDTIYDVIITKSKKVIVVDTETGNLQFQGRLNEDVVISSPNAIFINGRIKFVLL